MYFHTNVYYALPSSSFTYTVICSAGSAAAEEGFFFPPKLNPISINFSTFSSLSLPFLCAIFWLNTHAPRLGYEIGTSVFPFSAL